MRYPSSAAVNRLAVMTRATEYGFIAAGVTVSMIAALQSFEVVLGWLMHP